MTKPKFREAITYEEAKEAFLDYAARGKDWNEADAPNKRMPMHIFSLKAKDIGYTYLVRAMAQGDIPGIAAGTTPQQFWATICPKQNQIAPPVTKPALTSAFIDSAICAAVYNTRKLPAFNHSLSVCSCYNNKAWPKIRDEVGMDLDLRATELGFVKDPAQSDRLREGVQVGSCVQFTFSELRETLTNYFSGKTDPVMPPPDSDAIRIEKRNGLGKPAAYDLKTINIVLQRQMPPSFYAEWRAATGLGEDQSRIPLNAREVAKSLGLLGEDRTLVPFPAGT